MKHYIVRCDAYGECRVEAKGPAAARYQVFKQAREAGYFRDNRTGFRDFLSKGWTTREVRR
jgi:hypothetical protein